MSWCSAAQCDSLSVVLRRASTWMDTEGLLCSFLPKALAKYFFHCLHCRQSQCRVRDPSHAYQPSSTRPACCLRQTQRTLHFPPQKMPQRHTAVHVGCAHSFPEQCKVLRSLFTLNTVGQTCPRGVLKTFPDHYVPPINPLLVITGPHGDWRPCEAGSKAKCTRLDHRVYHAARADSEKMNRWSAAHTSEWCLTVHRRERGKETEGTIKKKKLTCMTGICFFTQHRSNLRMAARENWLCLITSSTRTVKMQYACNILKATRPWTRWAFIAQINENIKMLKNSVTSEVRQFKI